VNLFHWGKFRSFFHKLKSFMNLEFQRGYFFFNFCLPFFFPGQLIFAKMARSWNHTRQCELLILFFRNRLTWAFEKILIFSRKFEFWTHLLSQPRGVLFLLKLTKLGADSYSRKVLKLSSFFHRFTHHPFNLVPLQKIINFEISRKISEDCVSNYEISSHFNFNINFVFEISFS